MNKWKVSDIRWANLSDLNLPFWIEWNKNNPLPDYFWQRIWEYPYLCSMIPSSGKILDIGGTYPFILFSNFPDAISVDCRDLNQLDHPLHKNKWPEGKLVVADATRISFDDNSFDYAFSISAIEEMPHPVDVMKEIIRLASDRVVITMDVSDKIGLSHNKLEKIEDFLKLKVPDLPDDYLCSTSSILEKFGQKKVSLYEDIRVLGITIDKQ